MISMTVMGRSFGRPRCPQWTWRSNHGSKSLATIALGVVMRACVCVLLCLMPNAECQRRLVKRNLYRVCGVENSLPCPKSPQHET